MKPPENIISFEAEKAKRSKENKLKIADWSEERFADFLYGGKVVSRDSFEEVFKFLNSGLPNARDEVLYCLSSEYNIEDIEKWLSGEDIPEDENVRKNILQKLLIDLSAKIRRENE